MANEESNLKRLFGQSKRKPFPGGGEIMYTLNVYVDGAAKKLSELPNEGKIFEQYLEIVPLLHNIITADMEKTTS